MAEKCTLCGEKIEETFLGKIDGTVVKLRDEKKNKNQRYYLCSDCQKANPDAKEAVKKKMK